MSFSFIPDYSFNKIQEITPQFLHEAGIRLLMLDLDNTLAPYGSSMPERDVIDWCDNLKREGILPFIVSNNRSIRPEVFSDIFGISFVRRAGKPFSRGVRKALEKTGVPPENAALCGDQIYTDILAANLSGVRGILVSPIRLRNPLHGLRYLLELPFRGRVKEKAENVPDEEDDRDGAY